MSVTRMSVGLWWGSALTRCTRGATAVTYITVLGLVALVGSVAFAEFGDRVRSSVRAEAQAASEANGEDVDGPTGSLASEVATAGAEDLVVQGSWALATKAGSRGLASARRNVRGRGALAFDDKRRRSDDATTDRDVNTPPKDHDVNTPPKDHDVNTPPKDRDVNTPPKDRDVNTPPKDRDVNTPPKDAERDSKQPDRGGPAPVAVAKRDDGPTCTGAGCSEGPGCFAANTPVATFDGPRAIESIRLGDRVQTSNLDATWTAVEPSTWREVILRVSGQSGEIELELLRSPEWVTASGARVGGTVHLEASEIVPESDATVLAVLPAKAVANGRGRVVTGTFTRKALHLASLDLGGGAAPIVGTTSHPFYSVSQQRWVPLGDLARGELLRTPNGALPVVGLQAITSETRVYNLEVEGDHEYFVSARQVLVHNVCSRVEFRGTGQIPAPAPGSYRETYYDVGSGNSAMITTPGRPDQNVRPVVVIVDAGVDIRSRPEERDAAVQRIRDDITRAGPNAEIHVILSHPDHDHSNILTRVIDGHDVASITYGGNIRQYPPRVQYELQGRQGQGTTLRSPNDLVHGGSFTLGDPNHPEGHVTVTVHAVNAGTQAGQSTRNNDGLAVGITYGNNQHAIFTGDAQGHTETQIVESLAANDNGVTSLSMPHHGSATHGSNSLPFASNPSGSGLYEQAQPSMVVAQSGRTHNFPRREAFSSASTAMPMPSSASRRGQHVVEVGMDPRNVRPIITRRPIFSTRTNGQISRDSDAEGNVITYVESRDRNRATRPPVAPAPPVRDPNNPKRPLEEGD